MSGSTNEMARLPPGLRAFLAGQGEGEPWPERAGGEYLASRELFVEEQLLGQPTSRFVSEGGVRLNRVTCYWLSPDDLPALTSRRPERKRLRFVLVKFWLMFDELPPNRQYAVVRIRISVRPHAPALMLRPDLTTFAETGPVATAVDLGADGFGWTFEAQEGSPLLPRRQIALVLLELPEDVTELAGLFDAEALVSRRLLGTFTLRRSAPIDSAAPFLVSLADSYR